MDSISLKQGKAVCLSGFLETISLHSLGQSVLISDFVIYRFDSLSICQRVNALTCTSAFLTEILIQMYRNDSKKGIPGYFMMNQKKLSFQNYILEPGYSKHFKDQQEAEMQSFKYNQQFYLGSTGYQTKFSKYSEPPAYSFCDMDPPMKEQYRLHP